MVIEKDYSLFYVKHTLITPMMAIVEHLVEYIVFKKTNKFKIKLLTIHFLIGAIARTKLFDS